MIEQTIAQPLRSASNLKASRGLNSRCKLRTWMACGATLFFAGCGQTGGLQTRMRTIQHIADQATENGAIACAPRQLAIARAHLDFSATALRTGDLDGSARHLRIAEPNARAALLLAQPERCRPESASTGPPIGP